MPNPKYQTPSSYIGKRGPARGIEPLPYWMYQTPSSYYGKTGPFTKKKKPPPKSGAGARMAREFTAQQYADMMTAQQRGVLDQLLEDSRRRTLGGQAALGGFGAALQGYSHDLWGQTGAAYQQAAAQQQGLAAGYGGQMASGVAEARAQQAALGQSLGYTGETNLPTPEVAGAQVASEGGAQTGAMIGQVGTAWGGYGATRPEYIGFMTGQNQMQLAREQIQSDSELKSKFLELGMGNLEKGIEMWATMEENKRQNMASNIALTTMRTNIAVQRAKIKQDYQEMRSRAKTAADKLKVDQWYKSQKLILDQQDNAISQQNANSRTVSAGASAANAATARWKAEHPTAPAAKGFAAGTYQQKIGAAMDMVPDFLKARTQKKGSLDYVFGILWPQISPHVSAANRERAKKLLRVRIGTVIARWTPTATASDEGW